ERGVFSFIFRNSGFYNFSIIREGVSIKDNTTTVELKKIKVSLSAAQLIAGKAVRLIPPQGKATVIELISTVYKFNV
ncbi:hypothetical protein, partial [Tenacibaculum halocynthiae]|uniref:hypothetical protein n=1 Tax=Tenacibaculum halocynthiae TaxID=1254437 RepID=UPI003D65CDB7